MCDMHMPKKIITIAMMKIYFAVDVSIYGMQWVEKLVKECEHEI